MTKPNVNITVGGYSKQEAREIVLKAGIPLQDQLTETNAKYVVKWDFDLNGGTAHVPNNCTLVFDGGRIFDGTLEINYAKIYPDYNSLINDTLVVDGMAGEGTFYYNTRPMWSNGVIWVDAVSNLGVLGIIKKEAITQNVIAAELPAPGTQTNVIYVNMADHELHVIVSNEYHTPDGDNIDITVPVGGYGEVNFMNIEGDIYVRGI